MLPKLILAALLTLSYPALADVTKLEHCPSRFKNLETNAPICDSDLNVFLKRLKKAAIKDDPNAFAKLIDYPAKFNVTGKKGIHIKTKAQFIKNYKTLISPALKQTLTTITIEDTWQHPTFGLTIKDGLLWFDVERGIYAINRKNQR